jgi:hypothetical protein
MHHYTYLITYNNGLKYMGVRSCECLPEEDVKYFGSSRHTPTVDNVVSKVILQTYLTRKEAVEAEIAFHALHCVSTSDSFYNKANQKTTGFDTTGFDFIRTKDHCEKIRKSLTGRIRTDAERLAISKAKKGIKQGPHTQEFKDMVSRIHKGKTVSKDSLLKMVNTRKANNSYAHSDESKRKIKETMLKDPPFVSPVIFTKDGVETTYSSITSCGKTTGISPNTFKGRLHRKMNNLKNGWGY